MLGLVAAPSGADLAAGLRQGIEEELARWAPGTRWRVEVVRAELAVPPANDADLIAAARARLLEHDWDLVIGLTDLPLHVGHRAVVAHASPLHGVGLVSIPALGAVSVQRRARETVLELVHTLVGGEIDDGPAAAARSAAGRRRAQRVRQLALQVDTGEEVPTLAVTGRVLTGDLRLLIGMVRANRPWRLAVHLSRALAAAFATGVLALVTSDIWNLAVALDPLRLVLIGIGAVAAVVVSLIVGAGLWERARSRRMRHQVVLFNLATLATVVIGVLTLYVALLVLAGLAALLLLTPGLLAHAIGHPVVLTDYLAIIWLATSLATLGGALGAGLEADDAVRDAAYTHRATRNDEQTG